MLMRITWRNEGFYRLNIPMVPLCERTERSGVRTKQTICGANTMHEVKRSAYQNKHSQQASDQKSHISRKFFPMDDCAIEISQIMKPTKQSPCALGIAKSANFNIISTIIKGTAVSFMVFFLSFFAMNYEAYWDIARHSWETNFQPKIMQASSLFFAENNDAGTVKIAVMEQPLLSLVNPKTHTEENVKNILQPAVITPPDHRLIIPKIGKNVPIVESKADNLYSKNWPDLEKELLSDLKRGVVHYPGTAFPGQKGNVFLTGHSSYYPWDDGEYKDVFALLGKLEVGDEIVLFYKQKEYRYKVSDIREVKPNNVDILKQTDDNRLTLMTCTPVGTTLRRLVITALQV
ncbi:class D sortase [Candidatus Peregrinibacteria bacterium]|nr:class D sortase [Candidatus Peregrinibacteria bacterium]